ncbi:MAG: peptidase MA family metallohydrolase [Polyangiaceae bacterium]|nr:peptidase MA family metallohydrolase [Polyangiaceae bacterium]
MWAPWGRFAHWLAALLIGLTLASSARAEVPIAAVPSAPSATSPEPAGRLEGPRSEHPGDAPRLNTRVAKFSVPKGFSTFDGRWIKFAYHPSLQARVNELIAQANAVRAELTERLGVPVLSQVRVHVARTPGEMELLAPEGAPYPEYASGVAYSELGLVLLTNTPVEPTEYHDLGEVFRHELAHVALSDAVQGREVPRWFNEGFAVFSSGESSFVRLHTLWMASLSGRLMPLSKLVRTFPADAATASVAYAQAADFVRFMVRREDRHRFSGLVRRLNEGVSFGQAVNDSYGAPLETIELEWNEDVSKRYTFWPVLLGGSTLWVALLGLFFWGYRRKRKESKLTLARWAKEEALHDELERFRAASRVHIVLDPRAAAGAPTRPDQFPPKKEHEVPKVEHDGGWHTLH